MDTNLTPGAQALATIIVDSEGTTVEHRAMVLQILSPEDVLVRIHGGLWDPYGLDGQRLVLSPAQVKAWAW